MSTSTTATGYHVSNGQIIAPDGSVYVARGVNVMFGGTVPSAATLTKDFPGINYVRLAVYDYSSPQTLAATVQDYTSHGIVVELEDHTNNAGNAGGSQGTIFTGQTLTTELNWYAAIGSAFKNNPMVWFGTDNEPSEVNPATGQQDPAALSNWQLQTYQAIRNAGNNSPVELEANGWSNNGQPVMLQGYNADDYSSMTNVVWDTHYYGWLTGYSTDQATNTNFLTAMVQQIQQITSADGKIPVLVGEFGNSTTGQTIDANGTQVVAAVEQDVLNGVLAGGSAAWAYTVGNPGDGLINSDGSLSNYGQQIAAGIAAAAKAAGGSNSNGGGTVNPSRDNTVIMAGSTDTITDASGNVWSLANGVVQENGKAAGYSANVTELAYEKGVIWQENNANLWWNWNGTTWAGAGTSTSPVPAAPTPSPDDTVVMAGSTGSIIDATGNTWTLANGVVQENGAAAGYSANVTELAYVQGTVWQENTAGLWWDWNGTTWAGAGTSTSPLPAPVISDTVSVMDVTGAVQTVTPTVAGATVDGDTFSLVQRGNGVVQASLGSTPSFVTFSGSTGANVTGGSSLAVVTADAGNNTFTAGTGQMVVHGGTGADNYVFGKGDGLLEITDFSTAKGDTITVDKTLQGVMHAIPDAAGGTFLTFGTGTGEVYLPGVDTPPAVLFA